MSDLTGPGAYPPLIVIGMHRSGTGIVTRLLQSAGLFVGRRLTHNAESRFFADLNDWILTRCAATWDRPGGIDILDERPEVAEIVAAELRRALRSPMAARYMGVVGAARMAHNAWLPMPWGWKDPRNTFTLPLWLQVFPGAKVVCVERHGLDVALSLRERLEQQVARGTAFGERRTGRSWRLISAWDLGGPTGGLRCRDLREGLDLWTAYMRRARLHCERLGGSSLTLRYEDLTGDPAGEIAGLLDFAGLQVGTARLDALAESVVGARALAWKSVDDPEIKDLAQQRRPDFEEFGY